MLAAALEAVAKSNFDFNLLEVVVIDDGSSDDTFAIQSNQYPFSLLYLRQPNQGDALARNNGVHVSHGDLLVFLDDDVSVTPDLLASLKKAHRGRDGVIVLGILITVNPSGSGKLNKLDDVWQSDSSIEVPFTECQSGLLAISRRDFQRVGMWQPLALDGSSIWCDIDYAYRAYLAGFSFIRCSSAVGYHHDHTQRDLATKSKRMHRAGKAGVLLFQRHPQLQPHLPMFSDKTDIRWRRDPLKLIVYKALRPPASTVPVLRCFERLFLALLPIGRPFFLLNSLERWILGGYIYRGYRQGLKEFGPINPDW
jgi:glycosyltransferase involved in cell wall biosynthesis